MASCIRITEVAGTKYKTCQELIFVGDIDGADKMFDSDKKICASGGNGTWAKKPCDRTGIIGGCMAEYQVYECTPYSISPSWYYEPYTSKELRDGCPAPLKTLPPP